MHNRNTRMVLTPVPPPAELALCLTYKRNNSARAETLKIGRLALVVSTRELVVKNLQWSWKRRRMRAPWPCWAD